MLSVPYGFGLANTDENIRMERTELQRDSTG